MDVLPHWPDGTVAVLSTAGAPHAIPVSTAVRRGPRTIVFALSLRRASLERLRTDPRCAVTILCEGNVAFTAHGQASIEALERVARVTVAVTELQDHGHRTFEIDEGVRWHWTSEDAVRADRETRKAL